MVHRASFKGAVGLNFVDIIVNVVSVVVVATLQVFPAQKWKPCARRTPIRADYEAVGVALPSTKSSLADPSCPLPAVDIPLLQVL